MKRYIAEFIAAFFLVFAGTGAIVADHQLSVLLVRDTFGILGVALAHGLALAVVLAAVGSVSSGYANPAVSIALYISRRLSAKDLVWYISAQLAGGLLAALMVARVFVVDAVEATGSGVPALVEGTNLLQGGLIEVLLTFMLVFVIWGVAINPKGSRTIAPLCIGLSVTFGMIVGAPFTGAAMNPARWFGPAVVSGQFGNWPVWILGPIVGALLASTVYELFFLDDPEVDGDANLIIDDTPSSPPLSKKADEPEVTTVEPEVTTVEPEVTAAEPEVTTVEPEVTTVEPEDSTEPDTKAAPKKN